MAGKIRVNGRLYEAIGKRVDGWDIEVGENSVSASSIIGPSVPAVGDALCEVHAMSLNGKTFVTFVIEDEAVVENLRVNPDTGETLEDFVTSHLGGFRKAFVKILNECAANYLVAVVIASSPRRASKVAEDFSEYFRKYLYQSLR